MQNSNLIELQQRCHELMVLLEEAAKKLQKLLDQLALKKQPHRFAVVETRQVDKLWRPSPAILELHSIFWMGVFYIVRKLKNNFWDESCLKIQAYPRHEPKILPKQCLNSLELIGHWQKQAWQGHSHKKGEVRKMDNVILDWHYHQK